MPWNKESSKSRIKDALEACEKIEVLDLTKEADFENLSLTTAYRVQGVHAYVEIPNALALLTSDGSESERSHKRFLRFLNAYQRVADLVFKATDAVLVDFQNHRLHFIVYKPYDDEARRIRATVAIASVLKTVLSAANKLHEDLIDAKVCIGIESGVSIAVNNGTRGDREILFLGNPANHAAKLLSTQEGIFLGDAARKVLDWKVDDPRSTALTNEQLATCVSKAGLDITAEKLINAWKDEVRNTPLSDFSFSRPTPPLSDLDFDALTPGNSRRLEACALFADIDGFTKFVADAIGKRDAEQLAIRALHVIRKELRDVLHSDFGGKKVRYVGDCLHGVLASGTSQSTDLSLSVSEALLCAGAMRDAFALVKSALPGIAALGLAIGFDLGHTALTRLGKQGGRVRCSAGRAVLSAEAAQQVCSGMQTSIGADALKNGSEGVKHLFKTSSIVNGLGYNEACAAIESEAEKHLETLKASPPAAPAVQLPRAHVDGKRD